MAGPRNKVQGLQLNDRMLQSSGTSQLACQPDKAVYHREIAARINDPNGVDQSWASLCGAAVAVRALILENPAMYVHLAWGLFYGKQATMFGNEFVLTDATADNAEIGSMPSVDYATLASTRESVGWVRGRAIISVGGNFKNRGFMTSLSTPGDVQFYLQRFNFAIVGGTIHLSTIVGFVDRYTTSERLADLDAAARRYAAGSWCAMLINSEAITHAASDSTLPNHWIALDDDRINAVANPGAPADWKVWSWGESKAVTQFGPNATTRRFAGNFFGFIAATSKG